MNQIIFYLVAAALLSGCSSAPRHYIDPSPAVSSPVAEAAILIPSDIPYEQGAVVRRGILNCKLGNRLARGIALASNQPWSSVQVKIDNNASRRAGQAATLSMVIKDVSSRSAGPFYASSGDRHMAVSGSLYKDGVLAGSFTAYRHSGYRPFTGQCGLLERCADALAEDIVSWLQNPSLNAIIAE